MKIIPMKPNPPHGVGVEAVDPDRVPFGRKTASRRTFGKHLPPSRRTFGRHLPPSRRTFGRRHPEHDPRVWAGTRFGVSRPIS